MAGTRAGGLKAAATNKARYGDGTDGRPNFYMRIGAIGGSLSRGGGFAFGGEKGRALAVKAGQKGGKASRRTKNV